MYYITDAKDICDAEIIGPFESANDAAQFLKMVNCEVGPSIKKMQTPSELIGGKWSSLKPGR